MKPDTNTRIPVNGLRNLSAVKLMQMRDDLKHHLRKNNSNIKKNSEEIFYELNDPEMIAMEEDLSWIQKVLEEKGDVNRAAFEAALAEENPKKESKRE